MLIKRIQVVRKEISREKHMRAWIGQTNKWGYEARSHEGIGLCWIIPSRPHESLPVIT